MNIKRSVLILMSAAVLMPAGFVRASLGSIPVLSGNSFYAVSRGDDGKALTVKISSVPQHKINVISSGSRTTVKSGSTRVISASGQSRNIYKKRVVIDAGHGGNDTGAIGPSKILEKDVTLAVSLKLGAVLRSYGVDVVYTRDSDDIPDSATPYDSLVYRTNLANNMNADYFVSIHANSSAYSSAKGAETYCYSLGNEGAKMASYVQKELVENMGLADRGVKTANYFVIKNTVMPAILVELGFISNKNEEWMLSSSTYQDKYAYSIASGIVNAIQDR